MRFVLTALAVTFCTAADWPCSGNGHQKHEQLLNLQSVSKLQLVLKKKLGLGPLSQPVILGRVVTAKGIQDLVFVAGPNDVWAVDPDLGRILWQRHFDAAITSPLRIGDSSEPADADDDDDDDVNIALRPIYLETGGQMRAINPRNGADTSASGKISCPASSPMEPDAISTAAANGIRFVLNDNRGKAKLSAFNLATGEKLFSSGAEIESSASKGGLALANGHVCFGDANGTLYCYGFPAEL